MIFRHPWGSVAIIAPFCCASNRASRQIADRFSYADRRPPVLAPPAHIDSTERGRPHETLGCRALLAIESDHHEPTDECTKGLRRVAQYASAQGFEGLAHRYGHPQQQSGQPSFCPEVSVAL